MLEPSESAWPVQALEPHAHTLGFSVSSCVAHETVFAELQVWANVRVVATDNAKKFIDEDAVKAKGVEVLSPIFLHPWQSLAPPLCIFRRVSKKRPTRSQALILPLISPRIHAKSSGTRPPSPSSCLD